ncbi:MAG: hypothetical protein U1B80_09840 [Anaerolineaceae bacterium]|nr:hypothetical protein [Anaerolineaceae bacterium]
MKRVNVSSIQILVFIGLTLVYTGCATSSAEPSAVTPLPTSTPLPSRTPTRTPQPTATITQTAPATETPTQTPQAPTELSHARYFVSGQLSGWRFFISLQAPDEIQGKYYAIVDGNKEYDCQISSTHPNRLVCTGRLPALDKWAVYVIYDRSSGHAVFESEVIIPLK